MILHCSIPKPQLSSHTIQFSLNKNKQLQALPPTPGLEKIKNNMPDPIALNEEKAKIVIKNDKCQQRQFKIRSCSVRPTAKSINIQGRPISNMIPLEIFQKVKLESKNDFTNMVVKKVQSCNKSTKKNSYQSKEEQVVKINSRSKEKSFEEINLFKIREQTELQFSPLNIEQLVPLSHKVQVSMNDFSQITFIQERKYTLIVSFRLLNQEPKKYKQSHKNHTVNTQANDSPYSTQTMNILKNLSGPQNSKSFLKHCKLYFKVNSEEEQTILEDFLIYNNLYNYVGIINVQDKYAESMNLYNLKGVVKQDDFLIVMEDRSALMHQIPVVNGQRTAFILPNNQSYYSIYQMIENFKKIQMINHFTALSPSKRSKGSDITEDSDRENISPNILVIKVKSTNIKEQLNFEYNSSPTKVSSPSKRLSPSRRKSPSKKNQILKINGKLSKRVLDLKINSLIEKAKIITKGKQIRQKTRSSRNNLSREKESTSITVDCKTSREKAISRERMATNQSSDNIDLEGSFKDKMVTLTKILQAEKKSKQGIKRSTQKIRKIPSKESEEDTVQEMTQKITSKLQFKTPYQMVGQLLRNNSHIAKQINKYLKDISPCETILKQAQRSKTSLFESGMCDVMVYDYQ